MSGIEAAGLILAVIPLFISAAEHYSEGLTPIKRVFRTPLEIRKLYLALNDQKTYLRLSLIALFAKLPSLTESQKQALNDRDGDLRSLWDDDELQEELEDALGPAYESYIANLDAIASALATMIAKDKSLKLELVAGSQHLRALYDESLNISWKREDLVRRIRFSRNEKRRNQLLKEIEKCNENLRNFWGQVQETTPIIDSWKRSTKEPLIYVSESANCLHNVLLRCWQCQCCAAHDTLLRLERRQTPKKKIAKTATNFDLLFVSSSSSAHKLDDSLWQQMQVVVVPKSERPSQPTRLSAIRWRDPDPKSRSTNTLNSLDTGFSTHNIKSSLKSPSKNSLATSKSAPASTTAIPRSTMPSSKSGSKGEIDFQSLEIVDTICGIAHNPPTKPGCLGFVIDEERRLKGPFEAPKWHKSLSSKILNLEGLLETASDPASAVSANKMTLFKLERITLAVNLASSLLQLHATPWFNERWNKRDILFISDERNDESLRPVDVERPLLAYQFLSSGTTTPSAKSTLPRPIHPNLSVLYLGIMLLELWFAESIESRRLPSDLVDGIPNPSTDLTVAERWVKENADLGNMPAGYFLAVSSCIYCFFQPMPRDKSLTNPDFREAIWQNVVVPLEKELQTWQNWQI
ncbi:hypothetical protein N431DRAFT_486411 [Stipitochalara longipes BDJ]|nr:hypothetical protein N431DRAFT_486411 [Stipitochalara longipes BDJ]